MISQGKDRKSKIGVNNSKGEIGRKKEKKKKKSHIYIYIYILGERQKKWIKKTSMYDR